MATGGWAAAPSAAVGPGGCELLVGGVDFEARQAPAARKHGVAAAAAGKGIRPGLASSRAAHVRQAVLWRRRRPAGRRGSLRHRWPPPRVRRRPRARRRRVLARGWSGPTRGGGVDSAAADWIFRTTSDELPPPRLTATSRQSPKQHRRRGDAPGSWPRGKTWRQRRPLASSTKRLSWSANWKSSLCCGSTAGASGSGCGNCT